MLRQARHAIIRTLWEDYRLGSQQMQRIEQGLQQKGSPKLILDHFAIIDLPGPNTGIPTLRDLFSCLGYTEHGKGYLADKQNDFLWMAESDAIDLPATEALPQVVVADFRPHELPVDVRMIIEKYAGAAKPAPLARIQQLATLAASGDANAANALHDAFTQYISARSWPLPSSHEFETVHAWNKLLAWVLVFGRRPNHFTLSLHHLDCFESIDAFHQYVEQELQLPLNHEGGKIKGNITTGIAQGSTIGTPQPVQLADGTIELPLGFVEFVWRFPRQQTNATPTKWNDYFTGFVAQHADHVIESLTTP